MPLGLLSADASQVPATLHSRISAWLRGQIASGAWPAHYRLKPEPELAAELGVSRGRCDERCRRSSPRGSRAGAGQGHVRDGDRRRARDRAEADEPVGGLRRCGVPLSTRVLDCSVVGAPAPVAALLDTLAGQPILRLERLRSTTAGPVALLANFIRTDLAPGLDTVDFEQETLFGVLASRYGLHIATGRRTFSATAAQAETAGLLEVPMGAPLQHLEQVTYLASGSPIEYSDVWIRSDRLRVTSILTRH